MVHLPKVSTVSPILTPKSPNLVPVSPSAASIGTVASPASTISLLSLYVSNSTEEKRGSAKSKIKDDAAAKISTNSYNKAGLPIRRYSSRTSSRRPSAAACQTPNLASIDIPDSPHLSPVSVRNIPNVPGLDLYIS